MIISWYAVIMIICLVLLVTFVILGDFGADFDMDLDLDLDMDIDGHFEVGHGDFTGAGISPLSLPIIFTFGSAFGAFGMILEAMEVHWLVVPLASAGLSALVAGLMFVFLVKVFAQAQTSSNINLNDLVGKEAIVSIPLKPDSLGQIIVVTEERGRTTLTAVSDEEIATDSIVKIMKITGDSVFVRKK